GGNSRWLRRRSGWCCGRESAQQSAEALARLPKGVEDTKVKAVLGRSRIVGAFFSIAEPVGDVTQAIGEEDRQGPVEPRGEWRILGKTGLQDRLGKSEDDALAQRRHRGGGRRRVDEGDFADHLAGTETGDLLPVPQAHPELAAEGEEQGIDRLPFRDDDFAV